MPPHLRAARTVAAMLLPALLALAVPAAPALAAPALAAPGVAQRPEAPIRATLRVAPDTDRRVPADGIALTSIVASVTDRAGNPLPGRQVELRPLEPGSGASIGPPLVFTAQDGSAQFTVSGSRPGVVGLGLFDPADPHAGVPVARIEVEFTRKVVLLGPGFGSSLAARFGIFGIPDGCPDATRPGSVQQALACLGYSTDVHLDGLTGGLTVVDMSWTATRCLPTDPTGATDCVATIVRTAGGTDVHWRPADYDLASLPSSLARQTDVDRWAERLARTIATYDAQLRATAGHGASFYLVGHSLGGEVAVRMLHVLTEDDALGAAFRGEGRGLLQAVISVNGALNWTGGVAILGQGPRCGWPVGTVADAARAQENALAVERAHAIMGTRTVALTSATDPIVGPDVALLRNPAPRRGYAEAIFHADGAAGSCTHSALLWPEAAAAIYPLNDILLTYVGAAAGLAFVAESGASTSTGWPSRLFRYL